MLFFLKINFRGYTPRAPFKREGKRGREGNGKRRAVGREVIGMEGRARREEAKVQELEGVGERK
jgi:hypothetical protein